MRKLLTTAVLAFFTLTSFAQFSGSGSGTQSDPYKIFYADQLNQVRNYPNQSGVYFKLMEDIDLTDWITANNPGQGWEPIGIESAPFMGVFDGNGKTLTGFTINRTSDYVGFFGYISGATVKNLTMTGEVKGGSYTGAFAGAGSGTLTGLTFNGNVTGSNYTGGIIGNSQATMTNVHVYGDVKGAQYVGGNAGQTTSTISNATITGNVTATSSYGGGIVGSTTANISTANVTGKVTGSSGYVGGIAGKSSGDITNATASGDVKGTNNIGGICGQSADAKSFTNCCSTGNVNGSTKVGGICGEGNSTTFTNCYSYGNVTGTGNYVGGIAGRCGIDQDCCINNCISFGDVCGKYYVGGIAGEYGVTEAQPTLYEYRVYYSSGTYSSYIEKLLQGNDMTQSSISNSCAIGGIEGTSYVGGVAGLIKSGSGSFQKVSAGSFNTSHYNHDGTVTTYHPDPSIYMYVHRYTKVNLNTGAINYDIEAGKCVKGTEITISEKYYNYKQVYSEISVSDCYTTGSIKGSDNVGGVVGRMEGGNINNNYSSANIIGGNYVGGIVGYLKGYEKTIASTSLTNQLVLKSNMALNTSISATGNVGRIYGSKGDNVIVGINGDTSEDNRALHDTRVIVNGVTQEILDDEQNGVNNGAAYFKLKANYVDPNHGWDFNSNWTIQETETYPYKPWQAAPPTITSALVSNDVSITGKSIDGGTVYIKIGEGEEQSVTCSGTTFTLTGIEPLKSGSTVQLYTKTNGKEASYINQYTVGYPGSGTEADPWRVYSAEDLQGVYKAGYYKQMNDIDLTSWISANNATTGWVPVGYSGSGTIVYDGDNNKVTGLWTNTTDSYTGLFSSISSGTIKNLTLQLNAKKVKGGDYTGALIGRIGAGTIENVTVTGNVQGGNNTGGIVGYSTSTMLKNLSYSGQVTGSGATGGITAYVSGQPVTACQVTASTIKSTGGNVGGLIAAGNASVSQCKVTGTTVNQTGTGSSIYVAGLTANVTGAITQCHADATITNASASGYTAGLAAKSSSTIKECSATGSVTSTGSNTKTGGLIAQTTSSSTIQDCYSTASVSGTQYTAGLVGYNYGKVNRCYASGNVSSTYYGSGLVGYNNGASAVVTNCVALSSKVEVSDQSGWGIRVIGGYTNGAPDPDESNYAWSGMQISVNGIPKQIQDNILDGQSLSDSEIKLRDSYEALYWDFDNVWAMNSRTGLPYLQWNNPDKEEQTLELTVLPTMTYGDAAYTLPAATTEGQALTWTSSNTSVATISGNTLTIKGAGTATITATQAGGNLYLPFSREFSLTIAKAMLTVTAQSCTKQEGEENPVLTVTYSGFKYDDDASVLTTQPTVTTTATASSPVGSYPITVSGAEAANYNFTYVAGTLTVVDETALDNTLAALDAKGLVGSKTTLAIALTNANDVSLCQFDLRLPEGVTVALNARNKLDATLTDRASTHTISSRQLSNGDYRFVVSSNDGDSFVGNEGTLMNIVLDIAEDAEAGNRIIRVLNIELSLPEGNDLKIVNPADAESTLTINSYKPGDVNGDDKVSVTDVGYAINYILEQVPSVFIFDAADMNHDGKISVTDVGYIINIILSDDGPSHARRKAAAQDMQQDGIATLAQSGTEHRLFVEAENCIGFQMDVMLPQGIELSAARLDAMSCADHILTFRQVAENKYRILCYSPTNSTLNRAADALLSLTTTAATDGMTVTDILFTTASLDEVAFVIGDDATGIASMGADGKDAMYDLQGRRVDSNRLHKGIYLTKGRKSVKK